MKKHLTISTDLLNKYGIAYELVYANMRANSIQILQYDEYTNKHELIEVLPTDLIFHKKAFPNIDEKLLENAIKEIKQTINYKEFDNGFVNGISFNLGDINFEFEYEEDEEDEER